LFLAIANRQSAMGIVGLTGLEPVTLRLEQRHEAAYPHLTYNYFSSLLIFDLIACRYCFKFPAQPQ
jgi:hypothetical protein